MISEMPDLSITEMMVTQVDIAMNNPIAATEVAETFNYLLAKAIDKDDETLTVKFAYIYKCFSLKTTEDFSLSMEISTPFTFYPKDMVTAMDLYNCLKKCKDNMQEIANSIFRESNEVFEIKFRSYSDLERNLKGFLLTV